MRKKSHISLAGYLIDEFGDVGTISHKLTFKFGNIVPDLVPSFITKKHEIELTFDILEAKLRKIVDTYDIRKGLTRKNTKDLGVIFHYLADYFTFPHNDKFVGTIKDHLVYEKHQIEALKECILKRKQEFGNFYKYNLTSIEEICDYIKRRHDSYRVQIQTIQSDCRHIIQICESVIWAILSLLFEKEAVYQFA